MSKIGLHRNNGAIAKFEAVSLRGDMPFSVVSNIRDARKLRQRTGEIADWVVSNVPWTIAVSDWPGFHDRWPLLTRADLAAVEEELRQRGEVLNGADVDLGAIAAKLNGRTAYWTAAADWLSLTPGADIADPEFIRLFNYLSRAELILAAVEHKRRLLAKF